MKYVKIFTDGSCKGNPGRGGWGALLKYENGEIKELKGSENYTTNNRMELKAAIEALSSLKETHKITLTTDSKYMQKGMTKWLKIWKNFGWRRSNKKIIKNLDLWKILDDLNQKHYINWCWIKGHNGYIENEYVDKLAKRNI